MPHVDWASMGVARMAITGIAIKILCFTFVSFLRRFSSSVEALALGWANHVTEHTDPLPTAGIGEYDVQSEDIKRARIAGLAHANAS